MFLFQQLTAVYRETLKSVSFSRPYNFIGFLLLVLCWYLFNGHFPALFRFLGYEVSTGLLNNAFIARGSILGPDIGSCNLNFHRNPDKEFSGLFHFS